jgi:hypothetical protein
MLYIDLAEYIIEEREIFNYAQKMPYNHAESKDVANYRASRLHMSIIAENEEKKNLLRMVYDPDLSFHFLTYAFNTEYDEAADCQYNLDRRNCARRRGNHFCVQYDPQF